MAADGSRRNAEEQCLFLAFKLLMSSANAEYF
jgi:hypothetical protein